MATVYSVNNEVFATKDMIFGWVVWSYGYTPLPIGDMDKEQTSALQELFRAPTYPDELRTALDEHASTFKVKT